MMDLLEKGGPLVIPIGICSFIALAVFLERLWMLKRSRVMPTSFIERIEKLVSEQRVHDALLLCQDSPHPIAHIMAAALENHQHQRPEIKEAVEEIGRREASMLERYIEILGTCAAICPLLGLLGTVTGMMDVFQQVELHGLGDPSVFAEGIWKALITTAIGLAVAIPSYIFYKYLLERVEHLAIEMEDQSLRIIDIMMGSRA